MTAVQEIGEGDRERRGEVLRDAETSFRLLVDGVVDYAIYMLAGEGHVSTWNAGAERIKGYTADEIIGSHFRCFYPPEDAAAGKPDRSLKVAARAGRYEEEGWRVRRDGSRFMAHVLITALRDEAGCLQGFAKVTRDVTEQKRAEAALGNQALHDPLTGLPNRSLFLDRVGQALDRQRRRQTRVAVLVLDVDRFKWVNDSLGHEAGDELLIEIARRLGKAARAGDTVARLGGDEFVVLCEEISGEVDTIRAAQRFSHAVASPATVKGVEVTVTISIGIAVASPEAGGDHRDAADLVRDADTAKDQAKLKGRNRGLESLGPAQAGCAIICSTRLQPSALAR